MYDIRVYRTRLIQTFNKYNRNQGMKKIYLRGKKINKPATKPAESLRVKKIGKRRLTNAKQ